MELGGQWVRQVAAVIPLREKAFAWPKRMYPWGWRERSGFYGEVEKEPQHSVAQNHKLGIIFGGRYYSHKPSHFICYSSFFLSFSIKAIRNTFKLSSSSKLRCPSAHSGERDATVTVQPCVQSSAHTAWWVIKLQWGLCLSSPVTEHTQWNRHCGGNRYICGCGANCITALSWHC